MIQRRYTAKLKRRSPIGMTTLLHIDQILFLGARAVAVLAVFALAGRAEVRPAVYWSIAVLSALVVSFDLCLLFLLPFPGLGVDYQFFRGAGSDVWTGLNPYDESRASRAHFINPPTALPVFALFALVPERAGFAVWTVLNVLACMILPACAQRVLQAQALLDHPAARPCWLLPPWGLAGLAAALVLSDAVCSGLYLGQLSLLTTLVLLAALEAQARRRPILAGIWLALATMKVATMLPFLLLFLRKEDRRTWVALVAACVFLLAIAGHAAHLGNELVALVHRIAELGSPAKVNDYSFYGPRNAGIIGFDHALYRLGLRDRPTIRVLQALALLVTGLWVARHVLLANVQRAAACALVACYAIVFLYHRNYDSVILVLPLVVFAGRARSEVGRLRWLHVVGAASILAILYLNLDAMAMLTDRSMAWGTPGRLVQAIALPYAFWLVLVSMLLLVSPESPERAAEAPAGLTLN
jgi:hypothetical protein